MPLVRPSTFRVGTLRRHSGTLAQAAAAVTRPGRSWATTCRTAAPASRAPTQRRPVGAEHSGAFDPLARLGVESEVDRCRADRHRGLGVTLRVDVRCDFEPPVSHLHPSDMAVPRRLVARGTEAFLDRCAESRDVDRRLCWRPALDLLDRRRGRALRFGVGVSQAAARSHRDGAQTGNDNGPS